MRPHGLQHVRLLCPSPSPGVCSNLCQAPRVCSNWVGDAIWPSHPLSPPSTRALSFFPASLESDQNLISALLFYLLSVWLNHLTHSLSHWLNHLACLTSAPTSGEEGSVCCELPSPSLPAVDRPPSRWLPGSRGTVRCWSSMHPNRRPHSLQLQAPHPNCSPRPLLSMLLIPGNVFFLPNCLDAVTSLDYKLSLKKNQNVFANKSKEFKILLMNSTVVVSLGQIFLTLFILYWE